MTKATTLTYKYLQFVNYSAFLLWDIKRHFTTQVLSTFPVVRLGDYINEESAKYSISDPNKTYAILGVNNQTGIFDAYKESGSKIKQKYKKMQVGWIAYNPYRVNVGSIGIRTNAHLHEYISPAYVVFSCKNGLLPNFLFLLMKTDLFNKIIRENTTGSVRQNLNFSVLSNLQIPLPPIKEQHKIVAEYNSTICEAERLCEQAQDIEEQIENYWHDILGVTTEQEESRNNGKRRFGYMKLVQFKDVTRWDVYSEDVKYNTTYKVVPLGSLIKRIATGTTPPTSQKEYFKGEIKFFTPSDIIGDMYLGKTERFISQNAIDDNKARLFKKGDILFVGIGSTVGKVGIVNDAIVSSNQQITGFALDTKQILPEYAFCFMNYNKTITTKEHSKTTLPIVNQDKIAKIPIPLPPTNKQQEIVNHISILRDKIQTLKNDAFYLRQQAITNFETTIFAWQGI